MPDPKGRLHAVLRNHGRSGDLVDSRPAPGFELVCVTWGPRGTTLHRNGAAAGSQKGVDEVSSDPGLAALRLGGPGSGGSPRYRGDLAEVRVYDRQLDEAERRLVEAELHAAWFEPQWSEGPPERPARRAVRGVALRPWPVLARRGRAAADAPAPERSRLDEPAPGAGRPEEEAPADIPRRSSCRTAAPRALATRASRMPRSFCVAIHKRLGKTVPRGVPRVLVGDGQPQLRITEGSGRLRAGRTGWSRPDNPLTARVMVNRIWQHHFGEGLVRTPNDFGTRGERPSNPELLDWLAARFVESGWSVKAMHRLIMLSSAYQQSSRGRARGVGPRPGEPSLRANEPPPPRRGSDPRQPAGGGRTTRRQSRWARVRGPGSAAPDLVPSVGAHRTELDRLRPAVRPCRSGLDRRRRAVSRSWPRRPFSS